MSALILIVDDNPTNLLLAETILKTEGYSYISATDAHEALALLDQFTPSLILMDIQMPGMDGLDLTRCLKADTRRRSIPIVAVTSYAMKGDEEKARDAGCDGYITKPLDPETFLQAVASYVPVPG